MTNKKEKIAKNKLYSGYHTDDKRDCMTADYKNSERHENYDSCIDKR